MRYHYETRLLINKYIQGSGPRVFASIFFFGST